MLDSTPIAVDDWERVDALRATGVLDSPPEALYDDLAVLASEICSTPIALVSFVDEERQWFKARVGLAASETHRDVSVCSHAILQRSVFVVPDTSLDERFRTSSLVLGAPHMRFYAGAPILEPSGHAFGTVCVIDTVPRQLTSSQLSALSALARQAAGHLELRRRTTAADQAKRAAQAEAAMRYQLLRGANDAIVVLSADLQVIEASLSFASMLGYSMDEALSLHPWDWDATFNTRPKVLARREASPAMSHSFESVWQRKDGTRLAVEIGYSHVDGANGQVVLCIAREI